MRIGAVLQRANGEILSLKRRKGRGRTLVNVAGAAVEEIVLSSLLGGTSRHRFETLLGLNYDSFRTNSGTGAQGLCVDHG